MEIVFWEQSYSSLYSRRSLAWDHFCDDIANLFFCIIANFCSVVSDPCGIIAIPEVICCCADADVEIGDSVRTDADRCVTHQAS